MLRSLFGCHLTCTKLVLHWSLISSFFLFTQAQANYMMYMYVRNQYPNIPANSHALGVSLMLAK